VFRFDPDQELTRGDWAMLEQIENMDGPGGPWPANTPTLSKLLVWAWWGLFLSQAAICLMSTRAVTKRPEGATPSAARGGGLD
jgi:hypothetical protein